MRYDFLVLGIFASASLLFGFPSEEKTKEHPPHPTGSPRETLDGATTKLANQLSHTGHSSGAPITRNNYIDDHIFGKMEADNVPHAQLSSDEDFLRRVSLDLIGRLPEPNQVRSFIKDPDANKRNKLIDKLTDAKVDPGGFHPSFPYLDRWTYFFSDLYKNGSGEVGTRGRNLFRNYIHTALLLRVPYNELVTEMLTATTRSNWESPDSNYLARCHVDGAGDGNLINHEDTIEEIALRSSKNFLGVNLECVSCHDGAGHLEKINLWLSRRKRQEFWQQASFFGDIRIFRPFGIDQEFAVSKATHRFDIEYPSVKRIRRYKTDITPTFLLNGAKVEPRENPRHAYARILTSHPQFARATVNLIWAEMMGVGIVDPPFEFDLDRQDPKNPPPGPWTVQPTHPELLEALAKDFVAKNYDLRYIIKLIAKSSAYQLSWEFHGDWKFDYASYFARHFARRLSAEQLYDGIAQATGVFTEITIGGTTQKVKYAMQAHGPSDFPGEVRTFLASFGQGNRDLELKSLTPTMAQAAMLMNSQFIKNRVLANKGRLKILFEADPLKSNELIVEELFLATLGRFPTDKEKWIGTTQIEQYRETGAEDLLWSLLNKMEFLFNL